ncbi:hypothetical protein DNTS_007616 [Danionella cerebrum]|uniref:Peroxisomal membrane protein 4 n=1 Tax=Danionella cerebrum TaxID=2873325 RepID=A0A553MZJ8_9TELE|nr:hypothetical protein DNTS_007616 [Danionella translucida]
MESLRRTMASSGLFETLLFTVNTLLKKDKYKTALAVVKGFRNGAVYGAKIRAPHALVMTFLFRNGSLREKLQAIAQATYTHSRNLASFVFTYKVLQSLQQLVQGKQLQSHSFLAACVGGWLVFGENNNINSQLTVFFVTFEEKCDLMKMSLIIICFISSHLSGCIRTLYNIESGFEKHLYFSIYFQINMYLLSRILFGLSRLAVEKGILPQPRKDPFPLFATLVWGIVLWLFEYHPHTLQPSLQSSMNYLYHDSNTWHDITDFLIYNKPKTH